MNGRLELRIITQPYSAVYWGYFRRLVFGNSLTKHNKLSNFSYSVVICFLPLSHIPPCYHTKPPDFPVDYILQTPLECSPMFWLNHDAILARQIRVFCVWIPGTMMFMKVPYWTSELNSTVSITSLAQEQIQSLPLIIVSFLPLWECSSAPCGENWVNSCQLRVVRTGSIPVNSVWWELGQFLSAPCGENWVNSCQLRVVRTGSIPVNSVWWELGQFLSAPCGENWVNSCQLRVVRTGSIPINSVWWELGQFLSTPCGENWVNSCQLRVVRTGSILVNSVWWELGQFLSTPCGENCVNSC